MPDKEPKDHAPDRTGVPDGTGALSSGELLEADLSALVDGELEPARLLAVIDRLVEEPRSRDFYRRARALDGIVEATEPLPRTEAPHEVWQRIASSTGQAPATLPFRARGGSRPWSKLVAPLAAAAAVVLAVSLGVWMNAERPRVTATEQHASVVLEPSDITIGGREGQMTDERFLAIATEILEADRRYRREMAEIIDLVESALPSEMGSEEPSRLGEETSLVSDEIDTVPDGRVDRDLDVRLW